MMKGFRVTSVCLYIWISLVLLSRSPVEGNCRKIARYITHTLGIQSSIRPNIDGEWTSSGCEVRPGPKFVTRYIRVFRNSSWVGRFHHYSDYHCSKPSFTLLIKGHLKMEKESPHLKGSTTTNFNFTIVELHPHSVQAERDFLKGPPKRSCSNHLRNISTGPGIGVYRVNPHSFQRRTCRRKFGFAKYELSIVKLDTLKGKSSREDLLYFAEIPSPFGKKWKGRRKYVPTSYQLPLKRHNAPNCTVCSKVRAATAPKPYIFTKMRPRSFVLDGEWGSFTCETRPGSFLTRYMVFNGRSRSFEGYFFYYSDPYCKKATFLVYAKGHFISGTRNEKVKDGENYVFTVTEATITPYTMSTTRQLNSMSRNNECGEDNKWKINTAQDITKSKGCRIFNINLPHTEYDVLKLKEDENKVPQLFLGQRSSDGSSPVSPKLRPTSYQLPLVACSAFKTIHFVPPTPEPTSKPSTRYPGPKKLGGGFGIFSPKTDPANSNDKTTVKRGSKTSKGTKGSSTRGSTVGVQAVADSQIMTSSTFLLVVLKALLAVLL